MREIVWIALVHVKTRSRKSALSVGAKGAYANALALAKDVREFEGKIRKEVREQGLDLVEIDNPETFEQRVKSYEVSAQVQEIAESIQRSPQVRFDAFYNYFTDDEVQ
jgi:hypothetical protein